MKLFIQIIGSIIVCGFWIYLCYFLTDLGYSHEIMVVSNIPYWLGAMLFSLLLPIITFFLIGDYLNNEEN